MVSQQQRLKFDEIGQWSEIKLDIIRNYATEYSKILSAQQRPPLTHFYIDAFAGAGMHISRRTGQMAPGSPVIALRINPPFHEYHFIDLDEERVENLRMLTKGRKNVVVHQGNCNEVLLQTVFPRVRYEDYRRALCLLDPYGLTLRWEVIEAAGKMKSVDLFLNFPIMDMNRNVLWLKPEAVDPPDIERMNAYWGDDSWQSVAYAKQETFFDEVDLLKHPGNKAIVGAFRERLRTIAGFKNIPQPMAMRNSKGADVYYLFFASHKPVANRIVRHIFARHASR